MKIVLIGTRIIVLAFIFIYALYTIFHLRISFFSEHSSLSFLFGIVLLISFFILLYDFLSKDK